MRHKKGCRNNFSSIFFHILLLLSAHYILKRSSKIFLKNSPHCNSRKLQNFAKLSILESDAGFLLKSRYFRKSPYQNYETADFRNFEKRGFLSSS